MRRAVYGETIVVVGDAII